MKSKLTAFVAAMCTVSSAWAGGDSASLNVIHGVPGAVVDVCASGAITGDEFVKVIEDFEFGETSTLELPQGEYDARVVAAGDGCDQPLPGLAASGLFLQAGSNVSVVAGLDAAMGDLELSLFENELDAAQPGKSTVAVQHTADAPDVDVWVGRNKRKLARAFEELANGDQDTGTVNPGRLDVLLSLPGEEDFVYGPVRLLLRPNVYYAVYAVGVFPDSFTFIVLPVPLSGD